MPKNLFSEQLGSCIENIINEIALPLDNLPAREEPDSEVHKCELCGAECHGEINGDGLEDHICTNPQCPMYGAGESDEINARPITMEEKMKSFKLITESATGRVSSRMHRLLSVASIGKKDVLTEDEWIDMVGNENFTNAFRMGLLAEQFPPEEEAEEAEEEEKEVSGDEEEITTDDIPFDEPDVSGMEPEAEPEAGIEGVEDLLGVDDIRKVLEALKTLADESAIALIDAALGDAGGPEGEPEGMPEEPAGEEEVEAGLEELADEMPGEEAAEETEEAIGAEETEEEEIPDIAAGPMESFDKRVDAVLHEMECATPGEKIRSKGKGRGLAKGKGKGPIGIPAGEK